MSKQCNHMQKVWAHTVSLRHGHTDTLCINFPFFESSSKELYHSIWLVMHIILPSHIVLLHSRHKHNSECSDMHTVWGVYSQGRREFIRVQTVLVAGDNSIYSINILSLNIYIYFRIIIIYISVSWSHTTGAKWKQYMGSPEKRNWS